MDGLDSTECYCIAFPKSKSKRITGKALLELNSAIHERDGHICIIKGCGRFVSEGEKFHHVVFKSQGGSDTIENGVTLCLNCHTKAHGKDGKAILEECKKYIVAIYG